MIGADDDKFRGPVNWELHSAEDVEVSPFDTDHKLRLPDPSTQDSRELIGMLTTLSKAADMTCATFNTIIRQK